MVVPARQRGNFPARVTNLELEPPIKEAHQETILVVDDEESVAKMTQRSLLSLGYRAEFVLDAESALARCRSQEGQAPVDLVLTDLTMPKMTGLELVQSLRACGDGVPVMLCTGHLAGDLPPGLAPVEVLMKPFSRDALAQSVKRLLAKLT
jgi:CheY-like chemotaxis protein